MRSIYFVTSFVLLEYADRHLTNIESSVVLDNEVFETLCTCMPALPANQTLCYGEQVGFFL